MIDEYKNCEICGEIFALVDLDDNGICLECRIKLERLKRAERRKKQRKNPVYQV